VTESKQLIWGQIAQSRQCGRVQAIDPFNLLLSFAQNYHERAIDIQQITFGQGQPNFFPVISNALVYGCNKIRTMSCWCSQ
jgi:hypothetical protein